MEKEFGGSRQLVLHEIRAVAMVTVIGKFSRQKGTSFSAPNFYLSISLECPLVAESKRKPAGKGDVSLQFQHNLTERNTER